MSSPTAAGGSQHRVSGRLARRDQHRRVLHRAPDQAYLAAIASVTDRPVRTLINTHHHGDHTYGNCLFAGATIVAHEATRTEMINAGPPQPLPFWTPIDWGELSLELPTLTYTDQVTVWSDELRCEVRYVGGPAHTTNDSIVWLPERSVLFCGDLLFHGGTPFLLMGSVTGAIEVLETCSSRSARRPSCPVTAASPAPG